MPAKFSTPRNIITILLGATDVSDTCRLKATEGIALAAHDSDLRCGRVMLVQAVSHVHVIDVSTSKLSVAAS
jgi:hypothetical protein